MSKRPLRQTNFLGGELNPQLAGRTDLPIYARGLRTMRNFFPSKHGSAVSRPGTVYLAKTKNPAEQAARLLPFVAGDDVAFALEFGPLYVRFYQRGAPVIASNQGDVLEVATPYVAAHLRSVKYAQTGDVLTLTRKGYAAAELRRNADWTNAQIQALDLLARDGGDVAAQAAFDAANALGASLALCNAAAMQAYPGGYNAVIDATGISAAARAIAAANALAAQQAAIAGGAGPLIANGTYAGTYEGLLSASMVGYPHWTYTPVLFARPAPYFGGAAGSYPVIKTPLPAVDVIHPELEWIHLASLVVQETSSGRFFETLPWRVTAGWDGVPANRPVALANNKLALYPDQPVTLLRGNHLDTVPPANPANTPNTTYRAVATKYYRGRGDPSSKGVGLFGFVGLTTTDEFVDAGLEPDYKQQPVRGTNPFLTYDSAGLLVAVEQPIAVAFTQDRRVFGGTYLRPMDVFASARGNYTDFDRHVFQIAGESLLFEFAARKYEEVVHLVDHEKMIVGTGSSIRSLTGAQGGSLDFDSIDTRVIDEVGMTDVTPLLVDGALLFARTKGTGARALATDQGGNYRGQDISFTADHLFTGNGNQFEVWGATKALVDWAYAEDPWSVVWAVREDGQLLSLTYRGGDAGWARHDCATLNESPARFQSVCAIPEGKEDAVYFIVQRAIDNVWTTCVERMASRVRRGSADDDCAVDCCVKYSGALANVITGLDHLVGEEVWVVAKGNPPQGPIEVEDYIKFGLTHGGRITLLTPLEANDGADVVLYAGLPYVADLEQLDIANTESRMHVKAVTSVGLELVESRGVYVGKTFGDNKVMVPVQDRAVSSSYSAPAPESKLFRPNIKGGWDVNGRVCIRQRLPLPVTVTALTREVELGER